MPVEFKLPDLGEGIHEGEIIDVLVSVGDRVEDGQTILVIETDKATTEVPAPVTGIVEDIRVKPGDIVKVGEVLVVFQEEVERRMPGAQPGEALVKPQVPSEGEPSPLREDQKRPHEAPVVYREDETHAERPGVAAAPGETEGPVPAAPSTRRLARELGVDLHQVPPSGPGGRVTSEDVRDFVEKGSPPARVAQAPPAEQAPAPSRLLAEVPPFPDFGQWGPVDRVPLRSVRRVTARHMELAWSRIAHVTHMDTADVTELEAFRLKQKDQVEAQGGSLSLTVFMLKAVVAALKAFPLFNASLNMEKEEIVVKRYYHISVAVDTDRGLIVPVVRDVDRKSIIELARELHDLARRTREGKAEREDLEGGSFTITNIGGLGGTGFTPIVNYPQTAILGMAQARLQPVVKGDIDHFKMVPRLILPLMLAFDHRLNDGADAARFLNLIIGALRTPEKLLMVG